MGRKDWETHHALLHQHDNLKHLKPTPRGHGQSVIECYGSRHPLGGLGIVVGVAVVLGLLCIALAKGWI